MVVRLHVCVFVPEPPCDMVIEGVPLPLGVGDSLGVDVTDADEETLGVRVELAV